MKDQQKFAHPGITAPRGLQIRYIQTAIMTVSSFLAFSLRANLSVAIVAMTGANQIPEKLVLGNETMTSSPYPVYDWDEEVQGLVLSSFFWGYMTTQLPAGILTEKFGGHSFLCGAIFVSSFFTVILPPCAYYGGWKMVCVNRMIQGFTQGSTYPSIYSLLGQWAPPSELGLTVSIVLSAHMLGIMGAIPVAGFLSSYSGWPSVFYWFGAIGMAVATIAYFLGADSPRQHRLISAEEKNYIEHSLGGAKEKMAIPWREILTSVRVWSAAFTMAFQSVTFLTFLTKIPTYLATVLKFDIQDNGVISSVPYLLAFTLSYVYSWFFKVVMDRGFSLSVARKSCNTIAHVVSGVCMFLMPFSTSTTQSVVLLTISVGVMSGSFVGVQSNFVDLAPNFSGTLFSIGNFLSASMVTVGPIIVSYIVTEAGSVEQWSIVFIFFGTVMVLSNFIFVIFGTAETQSWNWPSEKTKEVA